MEAKFATSPRARDERIKTELPSKIIKAKPTFFTSSALSRVTRTHCRALESEVTNFASMPIDNIHFPYTFVTSSRFYLILQYKYNKIR